jgi:cytochrome c biogenesis protein
MATVDERTEAAVPAGPQGPPRPVALLRNAWRQLTSMRTALVLLFLLAIASIPGSVLPQRNVKIEEVQGYYRAHPTLAPILDRLGGFNVFGSAWFAAIYLLLFVSLIGCLVPRLRDHLRALRCVPPAVPARLERLPQHAVVTSHDGGPQAVAALLRGRRWRVAVRGNEVSAEKGYLKETGNLAFHFALLAILVGVGLGSWYGWHGNRILVADPDRGFCNTLAQYDESTLGPRVDAAGLPKFCLTMDDFHATYQPSGQPATFEATVTVDGDGPTHSARFTVNDPLRLKGASVYLLGHGYAPVIRYTDRYGQSQTSVAPFLAIDGNQTSEGAVAFPDANVDPHTGARDSSLQMGFDGIYLPTAPDSPPYVRSTFPAERSPALLLTAYRGNLGMDAGIPSSVYKLDAGQIAGGKLKPVGDGKLLRPGEKWTLDDGTSVEFLGTRQYVTMSVRHDPGQKIALVGAVLVLIGVLVSLTGRRRRVFFRVTSRISPTAGSSTVIEAGGLSRTDYPGFADEFSRLIDEVRGPRDGRTV